DITLDAGERIWTESSYKYEPRGVARMLEAAGFGVAGQWTDAEAGFMLTLAGPRSPRCAVRRARRAVRGAGSGVRGPGCGVRGAGSGVRGPGSGVLGGAYVGRPFYGAPTASDWDGRPVKGRPTTGRVRSPHRRAYGPSRCRWRRTHPSAP